MDLIRGVMAQQSPRVPFLGVSRSAAIRDRPGGLVDRGARTRRPRVAGRADPAAATGPEAGLSARRHHLGFRGSVLPCLALAERVLVARCAPPLPVLSWWRRCLYGNWNREVVQRREGVWLHRPCWWWQGRVRPPLVDRRGWVQVARRGRGGAVRRGRRGERPRGKERRRRLV